MTLISKRVFAEEERKFQMKRYDERVKACKQLFRCFDCGGHSDSYMLQHELWTQAVPDYGELKKTHYHVNLCFECVEKRLGRKLTISDFTNAPINNGIRFGWELAARSVANHSCVSTCCDAGVSGSETDKLAACLRERK